MFISFFQRLLLLNSTLAIAILLKKLLVILIGRFEPLQDKNKLDLESVII